MNGEIASPQPSPKEREINKVKSYAKQKLLIAYNNTMIAMFSAFKQIYRIFVVLRQFS